MDPEAAYKNMIEAMNRLLREVDSLTRDEDADILVDSVEALDRWLKRGGCLPKAWDHMRTDGDDEDNENPFHPESPEGRAWEREHDCDD